MPGSPWTAVALCFAVWFVFSCVAALILGRMIRRADRLAGIDVDYEPSIHTAPRSVRLLQERAEELRASTHHEGREVDQSGTQLIQGPRVATRSGAIRRFADPAYRGVRSARR
jgi:hypothetical protein